MAHYLLATDSLPMEKSTASRAELTRSRDRLLWVAAVFSTLILAFVVQGSRGIWEPDEGFYSNVAAQMVSTGDWWLPTLNGDIFLDKPPLHYWGMALGISLFGVNEWALRWAHALWFSGTALLVGLFARRLWGRRAGPIGTMAYAVTLAPFIAANVLTPDTPLTFWVVAMAYSYWLWLGSPVGARRIAWAMALGLSGGLGVLAKGPALLVFALPLGIHLLMTQGLAGLRRVELWAAGAIALALGGSWYLVIAQSVPGAWSYLFDNQVAGRLWSGHYERNGGWTGPLKIYLPTLLLGGLPCSLLLPGWIRSAFHAVRRDGLAACKTGSPALLLALWIGAPLVILTVASSRLPLYALPIMPALSLAAAGSYVFSTRPDQEPAVARNRFLIALPAWFFLLISLKAAGALWPSYHDSRHLAQTLEGIGIGHTTDILAVDCKRNALPIYGYKALRTVRHRSRAYPFFVPQPMLLDVLRSTKVATPNRVLLLPEGRSLSLVEELKTEDLACRLVGSSKKTDILRCSSTTTARQASAQPRELGVEASLTY